MSGTSSTLASEASGPAAGYYFQLRYALVRGLDRQRKNPTAHLSIEKLEDVAIEYEPGKTDLEQLKHSLHTDKTYSDSDVAVWRSIGNWARAYFSGKIETKGLRLFLVTNGKVAAETALSLLKPERDPEETELALKRLVEVASNSANESTKKDRTVFLGLEQPIQRALISALTVVEDTPNLALLGDEIEAMLHYVCDPQHLTSFRNELEGWWLDRVLGQWAKGSGVTIPLMEIGAKVSQLRERYKATDLVIDVGDEEALEPLDGRMFIRQMKALNVGPARIRNAQKTFLKAGAQRSKWVREFKVVPDELRDYDSALVDRWTTRSAILADEISDASTSDELCKSGRELLGWAEQQEVPIRNARAQFLTSGSYHALADALHVGWHPHYSKMFS